MVDVIEKLRGRSRADIVREGGPVDIVEWSESPDGVSTGFLGGEAVFFFVKRVPCREIPV